MGYGFGDDVKCPYCGANHHFDHEGERCIIARCEACGRDFEIHAECVVTFRTAEMPDLIGDALRGLEAPHE